MPVQILQLAKGTTVELRIWADIAGAVNLLPSHLCAKVLPWGLESAVG